MGQPPAAMVAASASARLRAFSRLHSSLCAGQCAVWQALAQ